MLMPGLAGGGGGALGFESDRGVRHHDSSATAKTDNSEVFLKEKRGLFSRAPSKIGKILRFSVKNCSFRFSPSVLMLFSTRMGFSTKKKCVFDERYGVF